MSNYFVTIMSIHSYAAASIEYAGYGRFAWLK